MSNQQLVKKMKQRSKGGWRGVCAMMGVLVCVGVLMCEAGCRDRGPAVQAKGTAIDISRNTFNAGEVAGYVKPGVYDAHLSGHDVYVVSNEHGMVVALAGVCPHDNTRVVFDGVTQKFKCPKCGSRFTSNGLKVKGGVSPTSMARCRVDVVEGDLLVRPSRMFLHENTRNTWSNPFSMYVFEEGTKQREGILRDYHAGGRESLQKQKGSGRGILGRKKAAGE